MILEAEKENHLGSASASFLQRVGSVEGHEKAVLAVAASDRHLLTGSKDQVCPDHGSPPPVPSPPLGDGEVVGLGNAKGDDGLRAPPKQCHGRRPVTRAVRSPSLSRTVSPWSLLGGTWR